jgi:hypothetical protein
MTDEEYERMADEAIEAHICQQEHDRQLKFYEESGW